MNGMRGPRLASVLILMLVLAVLAFIVRTSRQPAQAELGMDQGPGYEQRLAQTIRQVENEL